MAVVKNLMVRAGADFSAITQQAKKAKSSMSGMQSSVTRSCNRMSSAVSGMSKVLGALGVALSAAAVVSFAKDAKEAYDTQIEGETKLATVMRQRMAATDDQVKSVLSLTQAQQALGVVGDEVQLAGAQQLSTFLTQTGALETLIPAMNNLLAQQKGLSATTENAVTIGNMMGKVMQGQTSALRRVGITFSEAEEAVLTYGDEAQRAAMLAQIITNNVGSMNQALAATPAGRLKQVSNSMSDIKESFGQAVSSVLTVFLPALNVVCSVLASMATLANRVAQAIANVFGAGGSAAATTVAYTAAAASGMEDVADEAKAAGKATQSLGTYSFDTLQKMSGASSSGGGSGDDASDTGAGASGGGITETTAGAGQAGESVGWLEAALKRLKETAASLNFDNLSSSFKRLKAAAAPLTKGFFSGLEWAYTNIFEPLAHWAVEDALPAFLNVLAGAASVLSAALAALQPLASWLWVNFLQPIAAWTGGAIVAILQGLATALQGISAWISQNQGLVQAMTITVAAFFAAWEVATIGEFIINAGGLAGIIAKVTSALAACTVAKIADKAETLAIVALYVKDWAVALAGNIAAIGADVAAWVALRAEWIAGKAALIATTVAEAAHTAAAWASTAATTAFGVAMQVLTSPITLVIAAIAALIAIVVLLVTHWDEVKAAAAACWEGIKNAWAAAGEWFSTNIAEPVKNAWDGAMNKLKEWGTGAWTAIKGAWSAASSWVSTNVTQPITNGFRNFANGIIGFFEGLVNGAINGINKIIDAFNSISFSVPDWVPVIGGNSFGFNLPTMATVSLPRLAEGAVLPGNDPYLAIVNDQRNGTNIETPLATMIEAMLTALEGAGLAGDGNIQVNVRAVFDGQLAALARLLRPYFEADAKRVGNKASTAKGVV